MGNGITVRKNGKYQARCRIGNGKRVSKTFDTKKEAEKWLIKTKSEDHTENEGSLSTAMTLNMWFDFWVRNLISNVRTNTLLSYKSKYNTWIRPLIGKMRINEIKPYHCMEVFNSMREAGRKPSSIDQVRIVAHLIFDYAVENGVITSNPVTKSTKISDKITVFKDTRFLTRDEQRVFLDEAKKHKYYDQFAFILQTGLRYGELTGLQWSDIDGRYLHVQRSAGYIEDHKEFVVGPPKSNKGYRDIYLTDEALSILNRRKDASSSVFIFAEKGKPVKRANYNIQLKRICDKCDIEPFSIHKLRHSFATRCIESGMKPKTLQRILGHSDVTITLNYYVHITDNELATEMTRFAAMAL